MLEVRRETLEAIHDELAQAADIFVLRREHADRRCLRCKRGFVAVPRRSGRQAVHAFELCEEFLLLRERRLHAGRERVLVKVRIRDRREEVHRHEMVHIYGDRAALCAQLRRDSRKALRHIDQKVLYCRDFRLLAEHADDRAALAPRRFLALKAKHFLLH